MIRIENINKSFGSQQALKDISLSLTPGQSVAMIGPNGSGKTTLIKAVLGLVVPDKGRILVNDQDTSKGKDYRKNIGYMPQITRFPEHMKVHQLFTMIRKMRPGLPPEEYDMELYQAFEIEKIRNKSLGSLSGGMRQQVSASMAFLYNPAIVILDEPTAALDPVSNELLKDKIRKCIEEKRVMLITSHILNDLDDITNHVIYLMNGEVLFFKEIEQLRQQTSETQLNKIIVSLINQGFGHVEG